MRIVVEIDEQLRRRGDRALDRLARRDEIVERHEQQLVRADECAGLAVVDFESLDVIRADRAQAVDQLLACRFARRWIGRDE